MDLVKELSSDGYTNVKLVPIYDIYLGIVNSEDGVESISINGETSFNSYLDYPTDSMITIEYHSSYDEDPAYKESVALREESIRIEKENREKERERQKQALKNEQAKTSNSDYSGNYSSKNKTKLKDKETIAFRTFEKCGEANYPYGFSVSALNFHYTEDSSGNYKISAPVTITNKYGTKKKGTATAYMNFNKDQLENFHVSFSE